MVLWFYYFQSHHIHKIRRKDTWAHSTEHQVLAEMPRMQRGLCQPSLGSLLTTCVPLSCFTLLVTALITSGYFLIYLSGEGVVYYFSSSPLPIQYTKFHGRWTSSVLFIAAFLAPCRILFLLNKYLLNEWISEVQVCWTFTFPERWNPINISNGKSKKETGGSMPLNA